MGHCYGHSHNGGLLIAWYILGSRISAINEVTLWSESVCQTAGGGFRNSFVYDLLAL